MAAGALLLAHEQNGDWPRRIIRDTQELRGLEGNTDGSGV